MPNTVPGYHWGYVCAKTDASPNGMSPGFTTGELQCAVEALSSRAVRLGYREGGPELGGVTQLS